MTSLCLTYRDVSEVEPHRFTTEASTLGLKPGQWPERINTTMGNQQPFYRYPTESNDFARYRQLLGCIVLTVWND